METLYRLGAKPKRRPNLVKWMIRHNVGALHTSLSFGTTNAIEWLSKGDEEKRNLKSR